MNTIIHPTTIINKPYNIVSSEKSKVTFGKYCAVAKNLNIITLNHDYNYPAVQGSFYKNKLQSEHPGIKNSPPTKERTKGHVNIGNDVWIGEDVMILSGVTIGDGCCIGAKSVVTKSLPPYTICVGSPCKPVKQRYSTEIIEFLQKL